MNNAMQVPAMNVVNGEVVDLGEGITRTVASAHYSGPIDGSGITTLVWMNGEESRVPARMPMTVLVPVDPFEQAFEYCTDIAVSIDDLATWARAEMPADHRVLDRLARLRQAYHAVYTDINHARNLSIVEARS